MSAKIIFSKIEDSAVAKYARSVYERYKVYTGPDLINLTHAVGEPWQIVASKYGLDKKRAIDPELIRAVFRAKIEKAKAN